MSGFQKIKKKKNGRRRWEGYKVLVWSLNSLKLTSAGLGGGRGKAMVGRCTNYGCSPLCTSDSEATINNQTRDIGYLEENDLFTTWVP